MTVPVLLPTFLTIVLLMWVDHWQRCSTGELPSYLFYKWQFSWINVPFPYNLIWSWVYISQLWTIKNPLVLTKMFVYLSFVYQWSHKITPPCFTDYFKPISSVHSYYTRQSLNENLFVNPVQTTQYHIRSLRYTGTTLWNSLPTNVEQITPFFRFGQNIKI